MENSKKIVKMLILILILSILFIKIFFLKDLSTIQKNDDFLFLKLLSKGNYSDYKNNNIDYRISQNNKSYEKVYKFKINYKNMDFKSIDLSKTIDKETLIYEKIAPGTSGNFNILLDSNQNLKYRIEFESINEKPKNLNFIALNNGKLLGEADTLERLSDKLTGYINKNENINITIKWYWNFENEQDKENIDIQDTKDSKNIQTYKFNVYTVGEEFV